jgi:ribosome-binding protein aMBF1 (putative translation factor)
VRDRKTSRRSPRARSHSRPSKAKSPRGALLATRFIDANGIVVVDDAAKWFGMSKGQLAATVGVRPETLQRVERVAAPKTQRRVKEMLEIVGRIADWAGGKDQAMAWYRAEPLPAFGGRTAESLVKDGKAAAVRDYLDHITLGGFA